MKFLKNVFLGPFFSLAILSAGEEGFSPRRLLTTSLSWAEPNAP